MTTDNIAPSNLHFDKSFFHLHSTVELINMREEFFTNYSLLKKESTDDAKDIFMKNIVHKYITKLYKNDDKLIKFRDDAIVKILKAIYDLLYSTLTLQEFINIINTKYNIQLENSDDIIMQIQEINSDTPKMEGGGIKKSKKNNLEITAPKKGSKRKGSKKKGSKRKGSKRKGSKRKGSKK